MIGLLSGPSGVLTLDETIARRHAQPLEPASAQPAPVDAVHAVERAMESDDAGARNAHHQQELTTDERLRQDEALHAAAPEPSQAEIDGDNVSEPDPDKTINKMRQVRREALASGEPGSQDQSMAAKAARVIRAAEAELAARRAETLRQTAIELARVRDAAVATPEERQAATDAGSLADSPPPAAHQVSEYQRQAVMSAGSRLSSIPPPPAGFDSSV